MHQLFHSKVHVKHEHAITNGWGMVKYYFSIK